MHITVLLICQCLEFQIPHNIVGCTEENWYKWTHLINETIEDWFGLNCLGTHDTGQEETSNLLRQNGLIADIALDWKFTCLI